jgi:quinoprotein glucose dehydrogenase
LLAFLNDLSPQVVADAVRGIYDEATPQTFVQSPAVLEALAGMLRPEQSDAVNVRALAANRRLGSAKALERIAAFLESKELTRIERREALNTLDTWASETVFDPVDGRFFPVPAAASPLHQVAFGEGLWRLGEDPDPIIAQKAIGVLSALRPSEEQWTQVADRVADGREAPHVRANWLRWMRLQDRERFAPLGMASLSSPSTMVRQAAARELIRAELGMREVRSYLERALRESEDYRDTQFALAHLDHCREPDRLLLPLLRALRDGTLAAELRLDVLEAALARADADPVVRELLEDIQSKETSRGPLAKYDMALLGGDPEKGRHLFLGHALASCSKCHALNEEDQQVGPSLEGVASRRSRDDLLQSIIDPQAEVVPGYGVVTLTMTPPEEDVVSATLVEETEDRLLLRMPDNTLKEVQRSKVASMTAPVGLMPDLTSVLSVREVRDLVAFLSTLEGGGH